MDISNRFSLAEFLAYLFPGMFTMTGLYSLFLLTPLESEINELVTSSLSVGILILVLSFILGVIISGFAEILTNSFRHKHDTTLQLEGFERNIKKSFVIVFGGKENFKWTRVHFYICRSIVLQYMPNQTQMMLRQSSLRQLRMNILPSIVIWILAGVGWGWKVYLNLSGTWGIIIVLSTLILGIAIFINTVNRMQNNDKREIREALTAFLIGVETGIFKRAKQSSLEKK